jgi:hypothetical protein
MFCASRRRGAAAGANLEGELRRTVLIPSSYSLWEAEEAGLQIYSVHEIRRRGKAEIDLRHGHAHVQAARRVARAHNACSTERWQAATVLDPAGPLIRASVCRGQRHRSKTSCPLYGCLSRAGSIIRRLAPTYAPAAIRPSGQRKWRPTRPDRRPRCRWLRLRFGSAS